MAPKLFLALVVSLGIVGYGCAAMTSTASDPGESVETRPSPPWDGQGASLQVVTWNLGYGGLGEGSDFFADGGEAYLPASRRAVLQARDAMAARLGASGADVIFTQEIADPSVVNYWVGLRAAVDEALPGYGRAFHANFRTRLLPPPLRIRNGSATYVRRGLGRTALWPLPDDGDPYGGPLRRRYAGLATYVDGPGGCWVFVNVHLSAFDPDAALRRRQLAALFERAGEELAAGRRVVMGGDFNLRLVPTDFPHRTEARHLFWIHDFPAEALPEGWRVAADAATPSVRTNEQPYLAGRNYTAVVDGFIVSPNVEAVSVRGEALGFRHSDHQPVVLHVRPLGEPLPGCGAAGERPSNYKLR